MFAYELHRAHHTDLVREATAQRLSRQAAKARRAAKAAARRSGDQDAEGRVGAERSRFARAA
ncbi:hypothetical protein [Streptomyces sp. NPDC006551]|uniref:hypothetical protein n=1 Tax=Streptomyces sp. NPDC006551 TaxID=3157178 RepID=UPI0033AC363F